MRGTARITVDLDDLLKADSQVLAWLQALAADVPDVTGQLNARNETAGWRRRITVTAEWDHVRMG